MQEHATEAYLSALIDSTKDYIWSVDLDFKMVAFNRAAAQSFEGYFGRPIFPGMRHDEQLPPALGRTWADYYQRAIAQGPFRVEYAFGDGRIRDLSFSPIILDGAITGISVFSKDITKRKAEEKARLEAERKYRDIFNSALEGIFQVATDGSLLIANRAFATILGYDSPEEVVALGKYRQTVWVDPEQVSKYLQLLEETGAVRRFETEARRKDGAIIWVSFNSRKTFAVDGKTPIIEGFMEDITDRKLAELRILERDKKLREAEAIAHLGHFSWDAKSNTATWSEGLYMITGWDPNQPPPNHSERTPLYTPETWQRLDAAVQHSLATGDPYDLELQIVCRDGALRWVRAQGQAARDESGRVDRLFGTLQDISERKAEEKARLEAERKYREIFDGALEGIFQTSPDGQLLTANPALATMLGYDSPEEFLTLAREVRRSVWVDPEQASKYLQLLKENGVVRGFEAQFRRKGGAVIWVSFNCRRALASDGKTPINEGFTEDITDRKLAELRVLERDNKLREAEALAHLGHFSWNAESRTTTWSEGLYKIAGWDLNQPPPDDYERTKLYTPEDWKKLDDAAWHTVATGDPYDLELQMIRRDGALRWVRILGEAARNESGRVDRLFGTLQDITEQKLNEMTLRDNEERFRATFEQAAVGIIHVSFEGRILRCNRRFAEIVGYSPDEVAGMGFQQFTPPEYQRASNELLSEFQAGNIDKAGLEKPYIRKDGRLIWVRLTVSVQRDGKGQPLHLMTFVEDITDRRLAEEHLAAASKELEASAALHRTVFQTSLDALSISQISDGMFVDVNKKFLDITGFQREEIIGRTSAELGIWPDPSERQRVRDELRRNSSIRDDEVLLRRKSGETFSALISASVIEYEGLPHFFIAARDISEAKEAVKTIRDLAYSDPLTHLPNRRSLLDLLEQTYDADPRMRALLFVDLDKFKSLNDALGHHAGDLLLQQAAQRLASCVRGLGTVARVGGDEFAIVLENLGNTSEHAAEQAEQIGERILAAEVLPYLVGEHECHFSASVGISVFGSDLKSGLEALQQSEIAMSKAKEAGGNAIRFFSPELQATVNARVLLENELRKAIKEEQFELYFQPQVRGGRLIGSESLIRWNHPQRGVLAPGGFIELAEDTGLILPLSNWVFGNACEHVAAWAGKNRSGDAPVAVNISGKQFSQPDFVENVLATLDLTGANPASMKLELTETSLVKDFHAAVAKMTELKSHGLTFSVDDFGTGYSSLAYLRSLPLDQLKIDRAFVKDILVDGASGAIAQAIISMGHSMGFSVIAEGVETEEQRDFLVRIGCDSFQGYLYSRPLPADEFERTWFL